ncbi:MAG: hypothetical protein N838_25695, partial [Thiohalocapsa sp. PB-PSB1]
PIYLFLSAGAEAFRVLTGGQEFNGDYRFCSLTLKALERRIDGLLEPDGHDGPAYIIEFQGQHADKAWYNLLTKIGLYGEEHPQRNVIGVGVFLREQDIPSVPTLVQRARGPLLSIAPRDVLPDWLAREPDNPYVAVFAPLLIEDDEQLRDQAPALWRTVQTAPLVDDVRDILAQVLEYWFFDRFRGLTAKEIWAMRNPVTPIQETKAYQSIFAEGKAEDEAEGEAEGEAKDKAASLKRLLSRRFGTPHAWAAQRIDSASIEQLDTWLDGVFDTQSLDALIGTEPDTHNRDRP